MIRRFRPARILEIGCGYSTLLSAQALLKNRDDGAPGELLGCDPYPHEVVRDGVPGLTRLIPAAAQDLPTEEFDRLRRNDILFIDSSHVLKIDSDVQRLYLDVLPRLAPGVLVHVHDIFLPREYPREWVMELRRFWTEQYLLQAFLAFNTAWEVLWAGSYMHLRHPDLLEAAFPSYDRRRRWPGSFWLRRRASP
jgi:SAM-dependent methyltransferase